MTRRGVRVGRKCSLNRSREKRRHPVRQGLRGDRCRSRTSSDVTECRTIRVECRCSCKTRRIESSRAGSEVCLEDDIDALLRYLETHGEVDDEQLPEWDEFQELAADYEVGLS